MLQQIGNSDITVVWRSHTECLWTNSMPCQFSVNTFRVHLQNTCPVYVASGTTLEMVCGTGRGVCGAGVIPPKLKSRLPSKLSFVNTSLVICLAFTKGMNAVISTACKYVSPRVNRKPGDEVRRHYALCWWF